LSDYETLGYATSDHVTTITMDRPEKKNAMSWTMFKELRAAFERAGGDPGTRCVVLTGAGGAFCSGADLSDPENLVTTSFEAMDRMRFVHSIVRAFINCPKPTIAKVEGVAAGAGANLAFGCDLIVASEDATFHELFVKRGLVVDFGGTWALTRLLPLTKAKELAFFGDALTATEAEQLGIVNVVCAADKLEAVASEMAERLTALPPRALQMIKANLNRAVDSDLESILDDESAGQALALTSEDTREAVMSFLEKREPKFTGR
jgi:2-(1,2-epoxy-1,2-dihydrophenyl)acetyl-CoA isomerase